MEKQTGGRFANDKPTYAQMMQFQKNQISLFDDESLECFCGD
jgi:hypothetical protein